MLPRIFGISWFWVNYIALLIITLPFPMLEITVNGKKVRTASIWECYYALLRLKIDRKIILVLILHIFLTLLICTIVWMLVFRTSKKNESHTQENPPEV